MRTEQQGIHPGGGAAESQGGPRPSDAARKRAAIELIRHEERTLRRTARRYSVCEDDAEDAFQRALEILLTKAPTDDQRQLIKWMQTVTKHEALAVRRQRERLLGRPPRRSDDDEPDWLELVPSDRDGPADVAERNERIARCREALQTLKPQELHALTLLAEGFSYEEIGERTGWTYTKINRSLAEGRQRFRRSLVSSETGERCTQLELLLSAFCDGESREADTRLVREHLRVCSPCRATVRAYRAAPAAAAALAPAIPISRSLLERAHDTFAGLHGRVTGRGSVVESTVGQLAATGGARGGGMAVLAKVLVVCAGTAGGAAACVAAGVVPAIHLGKSHGGVPVAAKHSAKVIAPNPVDEAPAQPPPEPIAPPPDPVPEPAPAPQPDPDPVPAVANEPAPAPAPAPVAAPAPTVEFTPESTPAPAPPPAPTPAPTATSSSSTSSAGTGAGEFGP